jgi:ABC-type xylose transport system substrate-binding protein
MLRARLLTCALVVLAPLLAGCDGDEPTIALLVADASDSSSRAVDVEQFTDRVEATCDECVVTVYDAEGAADTQRSQARQAEARNADVVVVVPVDPDDLASLVGYELPVVSLGELVPGSDGYVGLEGGGLTTQAGTDLEAAREVLLGDEDSMTYVPTRAMSDQAADIAVALLAGTPPADLTGADPQEVDGIDSWLHEQQDVTVDSLTSVLVGQGVITLDELCTGGTEKRCARLGLR